MMQTLFTILLSVILITGCGQEKTKNTKLNDKPEMEKQVAAAVSVLTDTVFTFNNCQKDELPDGWLQYATGKKKETDWRVIEDNGNKVLAQLSEDNPNDHFNVVIYNKLETRDMEMEVRMKSVAGKMDRGGGFVWRFKDADNYYVVRANPLEDNVVMYKVVDGKRTDLALVGKGRTYGMDVPSLGEGWNTLKLAVKDDLFAVFLNGQQLFQVNDSTFSASGKLGLWTKADAVSYFDDFIVTPEN